MQSWASIFLAYMLVFPSRVLILNMRFGCPIVNFLFFKRTTNLNRKVTAQENTTTRLFLSLGFLFFKVWLVFIGADFGGDESWKYSLPHTAAPEDHADNSDLIVLNAADAKTKDKPRKRNYKHCHRGRPILPRTVNVPGSVRAEQAGAATWVAQAGMGGRALLSCCCTQRRWIPSSCVIYRCSYSMCRGCVLQTWVLSETLSAYPMFSLGPQK